jgi:hypothetical protein
MSAGFQMLRHCPITAASHPSEEEYKYKRFIHDVWINLILNGGINWPDIQVHPAGNAGAKI